QENSYVPGEKWIAAHVSLFGSNPKERQVYYRVPAYVVIDGSDYRYGGFDNYAASGMITESYNPGFYTEQAYYFLSDVTTMDLANAAEVESFKFHHNDDVDAYDDPVFSYTFKVTPEAIAANGGCKWRVAPQSTVGTSNWAKTIGPKYDGDTELQGELVSENAGYGLITKSGRYELTINMKEMTYTLVELPNVIYMVGAPQGWNINNNAVYLPETYDGSNIYSGLVKVDAGQGIFRFYSQLGNWDKSSIGAADGDSTIDITLDANGVYTGSLFETGVNANNSKFNWQLPNWAGGALEITLNLNAMTIEIKKASVNTGIYLRGGMNGWGSDPAYEFLLTNETGIYAIDELTISANTEFKVADASWGAINFGAGEDNVIVPDTPYELVAGSQKNISLKVDFNGKATLTKTGAAYSLMLITSKDEE
ncbi:MAG: hypothetical protein K2K97_05460, partial [Muribaculaceae bacterium]|nr:hypothetical protein [Muribaculaceae bacterium]